MQLTMSLKTVAHAILSPYAVYLSDRQTGSRPASQTDRQEAGQPDRQTDRKQASQTDRQTGSRPARQTDRQRQRHSNVPGSD